MNLYNKYNNIPKNLLLKVKNKSGRNNGKITVRHKGGGNKFIYTNIDLFNNNYDSSLAIIIKFYLDYSRTSIIALILLLNGILKGCKKLIISTRNLKIGNIISFKSKFPLKLGSVRFLSQFPIGYTIHSIEILPGSGAKISRSLGTKSKIIYHTSKYTCIEVPSGQIKLINNKCLATMGQNSNMYRIRLRKAGHKRELNIRPTVRGIAMNPVDHPHGGGCGHSSVGLKSSKTPWGKYHYGVKTTKFKKFNKIIFNKYI
uniref:Ribosomal protein L2 n=1 Tax=Hepatozoon canis TaxID=110120 RepID=A0A3S8TEN4_9APIC|nr:ribosomal protein L2 [Hepatozoon canis]